MAKIHTLTYNGTKSSDLGVFVTGSGSFDAAELDVDKYEIPGRNGDLILSNNRYKNIEITYPAFIPKAFMDKAQNVRNWLRSSRVYARLEDTYDTDHYRLGIPTGVQSFSPANRNDGANFEMTFDCKPQRFLKSGETPETVEADVQTESGEIVTFETVAESPMTSAEVSLSPQQDLNGYDSPWPGGGGKNLLFAGAVNETRNGLTITAIGDGSSFRVSGTANANTAYTIYTGAKTAEKLKSGVTYTLSGGHWSGTGVAYIQLIYKGDTSGNTISIVSSSAPNTYTASEDATLTGIYINFVNGNTFSNDLVQPQFEIGSTATTFSPYSNICPISGHTGAELIRTGKNLWKFNASYQSASSGTLISNQAYVLKAGTYTLSMNGSIGAAMAVTFRDSENNIIVTKTLYSASFVDGHCVTEITLTRQSAKLNIYSSGAYDIREIQLELGSATAYEPYQGDTYSVTFTDQGTVYGGTYDFVSGKLTVTMASVDLGTLSWTYHTQSGNMYAEDAVPDRLFSDSVFAICERYVRGFNSYGVGLANVAQLTTNGAFSFMSISLPTVKGRVVIRDTAYTDAATFKTAMNGVKLVYELATPIEYTLSAQQIETLLGENNVWSDAGPITLTYAEPFTIENPTMFDARPLFTVTNPAEGDVITVNGQAITFVDGYSGTVFIDCETMNAYSGAANLNSIIEATDFPVLVPGTNIVTWTGTGVCTMTPRWWEL